MQLRLARVCLDCEEVHDALACPLCASERFTALTRWVPAPDRPLPLPPRPTAVVSEDRRPGNWLTGGVVGVAALGIAGFLWRYRRDGGSQKDSGPP